MTSHNFKRSVKNQYKRRYYSCLQRWRTVYDSLPLPIFEQETSQIWRWKR